MAAMPRGDCTAGEAEQACRRAIANHAPPPLQAVLLRNTAALALARSDRAAARADQALLDELDDVHGDPALMRYEAAWRLARAESDYAGQRRALDAGLATGAGRVSRSVITLQVSRFQLALEAWWFSNAAADLSELHAVRERLPAWGITPWPALAAAMAVTRGRAAAARADLATLTADERRVAGALIVAIEAKASEIDGDHADLARRLQAWTDGDADRVAERHREVIGQPDLVMHHATMALTTGAVAAANALLDDVSQQWVDAGPDRLEPIARLRAAGHLALGEASAAAALAERWQADHRHPWLAIRFRLALATGDDASARAHLAEILRIGDWPLLHMALRIAPEVNACDLARLAPQYPSGPPVSDATTDSTAATAATADTARPATPRPATNDRRQDQLIALCRQHAKITRKLVVEQLGCAPATARREIDALVAAGRLRYRNPTSHPRTGWWEWLDDNAT